MQLLPLKSYLYEELRAVLVWAGVCLVTARAGNDLKGKLVFQQRRKLINQRSVPKEQSVIREVKGKVTKIPVPGWQVEEKLREGDRVKSKGF